MQLSLAGRMQLRVEEGFRLKAYQDSVGVWTIGVGQTTLRGRPVQAGDVLTSDEVESTFSELVQEFEAELSAVIKVPVAQEQFDALFMWCWNVGLGAMRGSTLIAKLNQGDYQGAADQFSVWNKVTRHGEKVVDDALTARRRRERDLFLSAMPEQPAPAPITESQPTYEKPQEKSMVAPLIPIATAVIPTLVQKLLEVLPWFSSGSPQAERNIKAIQTVGPALIDMAKAASGQAGVVEAVDAVVNDATVQKKFVQSAAEKWDEIAPYLEFEEKSRQTAREWVTKMTAGNDWRALGVGLIMATLSVTIVLGGGWLFWEMLQPQSALSSEQKGMVLGSLILAFGQVIQYWFGSAASSRSKDRTIQTMSTRQE